MTRVNGTGDAYVHGAADARARGTGDLRANGISVARARGTGDTSAKGACWLSEKEKPPQSG